MDNATDATMKEPTQHERRMEYTNPALIALLRQSPTPGPEATPDTTLLERRFSLARRVRAYDATSALSDEAQHGRKIAVAELDACEAECRMRGLIR